MVQLKFCNNSLYRLAALVLIPVWCNWNTTGNSNSLLKIICFNSCMVQLKLTRRPPTRSRHCCFNSCIVQLKSPSLQVLILSPIVLIPVWCNWNDRTKNTYTRRVPVLIPVWCNWNESNIVGRIPPKQVLIPVWCNWNCRTLSAHLLSAMF